MAVINLHPNTSSEPVESVHTDIYYLGNLVRERFLKVRQNVQTLVGYAVYAICQFKLYSGFEFMIGLVDAMTDENPAERPTIENLRLT